MKRKEPYVKKVPRIIVHWDYAGEPFCGVRANARTLMLTDEEFDVTCKRCLASIGCQDASNPKNSSLS